MYDIINNQDLTKMVRLKFLRSELLYDIGQYGYVEGDVQKADADHLKEAKHQTQDVIQDGNIDLVTRRLDLALTHCRVVLHPYTKTPVEDGKTLDDTLRETQVYEIILHVPEDFPDGDAEHLEQLIHNLLIFYVLWGWLSITKPEAAEKWLIQANNMETEIKGALARRCGKVYRRMSPFDSGTGRR